MDLPESMTDSQLMRELMFAALDLGEAKQRVVNSEATLALLQTERAIRLLMATNEDTRFGVYDRASAMAALESMTDIEGKTLSQVLQELTPELDVEAWARGEYKIVEDP